MTQGLKGDPRCSNKECKTNEGRVRRAPAAAGTKKAATRTTGARAKRGSVKKKKTEETEDKE
jgi:hypothetical protein